MNINDVKTLKAKRVARKGSIKRLEKHLDKLAGVTLARLHLTDTERKMAVLQENIQAYDFIQERISQVCTTEQLEAEEEDEMKQRSHHAELQEAYQILVDACQAWHHGYQIQETICELFDSEDVIGTYARKAYEQVAADLKEYRRTIMKMPPDEELNRLRDELNPAFRELTTKMDEELRLATTPDISASSHHSSASPVTARPPPSKLKLEIPRFSGDILQWKDFWHVFSSIMEKETTLSDAEKICHLTTAMQSPEAKTVVQRAAGATDSYAKVVEALEERYDRCKTVYLHHVKKIESQGPIAYTHASLRESLGFIQDRYQGLARNKGLSLDQYLAAHVELLMDDTCKSHWGVYSAKNKLPPTLDDVCGFLKERMYTLPEEESPSVMPSKRATTTTAKTTTSKPADTRPTVLLTQERSSSGCVVCGDQNHYVYQCPTFHSYDVPKRTDIMNQHQLCYNCLCPGHNLAACKNKKTCRECGRRHHTMLHRPDRAAVRSASQRSHAVASPRIIPQTALVTATASRRPEHSWTQGQASRLSPPDWPMLKAKHIPCHTEINGIGGQMISTHQVEVELSSAFCEEEDHITVRAHVVGHFTDDYLPQELGTIRSLPFLEGKPLADPEFDRSGKVDLLLGIVACNQCTYDEVVSSPNRKFKAHRTIFGWTIGGEQPTSRCSNERPTVMRTTAKEDPTYALLKEFWTLEQVPGCSNYFTAEEDQALYHFKDTVQREPDGRYQVRLPRKVPTPELGQSRGAAQRRFLQNERSLAKKDQLQAFQAAVRDYEEQGHSEIVPVADLEKPPNETFYLPMFGVVKESSTSTKLRVVYDASAKSSTGSSLNDTLLPGPNLYLLLTTVILRFRVPHFAMSADISKMFREVSLHPDERDFHRYITRNKQGQLQDQ